MNKILKAALSHYIAQRDYVISELDIILNKSNNEGDTKKCIDLIKELSLNNLSITYIQKIIDDNNENPSVHNIEELDLLAKAIENKIINTKNDNEP